MRNEEKRKNVIENHITSFNTLGTHIDSLCFFSPSLFFSCFNWYYSEHVLLYFYHSNVKGSNGKETNDNDDDDDEQQAGEEG